MLQHSQAHVRFLWWQEPTSQYQILFSSIWPQITHKLRGFKQQSFLLFLTLCGSETGFSSTGSVGDIQLVSGLVLQGPHGWHVGGDDGMPGSAETVLQSPTQGFSSMAHTTVSSITWEVILCTENIPRDCKLPGFFRHGFGNWHSMTTALCRGHSSSSKGRGQNPASQWDNCQGIYGYLCPPYSFSISSSFCFWVTCEGWSCSSHLGLWEFVGCKRHILPIN